jgi:ribosomal protein S18 acetylase RimI-like enzyme
MPAEIALRPVNVDDEDLLFAVYAAVRKDEVAAFGWGEEQANAFLRFQFASRRAAYALQFPAAEYSVILVGARPAGSLIVERRDDAISLTDIAILPEFQRHGAGSRVLDLLKNEAAAAGKPLVLSVDHTNPIARQFYLERGFRVTGTSQINCSMRWTPDEA